MTKTLNLIKHDTTNLKWNNKKAQFSKYSDKHFKGEISAVARKRRKIIDFQKTNHYLIHQEKKAIQAIEKEPRMGSTISQ